MTEPRSDLAPPAPEPGPGPVSWSPPGAAAEPAPGPVPAPAPWTAPAPWASPARERPAVPGWLIGILVAMVAIGAFGAGASADRAGLLPGSPAVTSPAPAATDDADLALIEEAWRSVLDNYVDAQHLDRRALAYGAIDGLTDAVGDEGHTQFYTAEEAKAIDQSLSGTFVGIGIQLSEDDERPVVGDVIPSTPAEEAGLRRGDVIAAVDGSPTEGLTIDEVVSIVRGPEDEPVTLTISRPGVAAKFDVTIVRRQFDLPLVGWAMVPGRSIALVRLEQFATRATEELKAAIREAREAGATAIVLDLRANPGGYVTEAVGVASQFVGDGTVYRAIDASGVEKETAVQPGGLATDLPLVVLADRDTASAAEIVTGAVQDARRGRVVGEKTFGTGTVLGRFDLADGSSLRIGVERWLTRDGRPIWHEGLVPDVLVPMAADAVRLRPAELGEMDAADLAASDDVQLRRAVELLADAA